MQIVDCSLSAAAVQDYIDSVPEIKDYLNKEMNCQDKGIAVLKSYKNLTINYINMARAFILSAILLVFDLVFFNKQYSKLLLIIMAFSIISMVINRIYSHYKRKKVCDGYSKAVNDFNSIKNVEAYAKLLELLESYKKYEAIKEMEKVGELTFATKESEETIYIKNKNETKAFGFGNLFSQIVSDKVLVFEVLDKEFLRLKKIIVEK